MNTARSLLKDAAALFGRTPRTVRNWIDGKVQNGEGSSAVRAEKGSKPLRVLINPASLPADIAHTFPHWRDELERKAAGRTTRAAVRE